MEAPESQWWEAALLSCEHRLKKEPSGAHLSMQTKWSSLSIKKPLRSTRLATGCHCYSTHTHQRGSLSVRGWVCVDPGLPSASPLSELPALQVSASSQAHVPYKSHEPACPIVSIFLLFCIKGRKEEKGLWKEEKDHPGPSHQKFSKNWTLNITTLDKSNGLLIHFTVFSKDKDIFCLFSFSQISGKEMEYLRHFCTILTLRRDAALYSTEMRPTLVKPFPLPQQACLNPPWLLHISWIHREAKGQGRMCAWELASWCHLTAGTTKLLLGSTPGAPAGAGEAPSICGCQLLFLHCYKPSEGCSPLHASSKPSSPDDLCCDPWYMCLTAAGKKRLKIKP